MPLIESNKPSEPEIQAQQPKPEPKTTSSSTSQATQSAKAPSDIEVTLSNGAKHTIPVKGQKSYHIEVEVEAWNRGEKMSTPHVVTVVPSDFQRYMTDYPRLGLTIHNIHHDPQPDKTPAMLEKAAENRAKGKIAK